MGDNPTTDNQLSLEMQINQALQSRLAILKSQEKALSGQVQLAVDLCKALRCEQLDDIEARLRTARQAMEDASRSAGVLGNDLSSAGSAGTRAADDTTSAFDRLRETIDPTKAAIVGLAAGIVRGFGAAYQSAQNLIMGVSGVVSSVGKLSMQILTLPLQIMENLFSVAQSTSGQGPSPVRIELEKLRGEFGDLSVATGKVAASALDQFRGQLGSVGKSGLSVSKIFGTGPEGMAAAIRDNAELMKAMGPAVDNFSEELSNNAGELTIYRKGLGLTAEQQAKIMNLAKAMGEDPLKAQQELASGALSMQNQFGISAKKIGQDVATMKGDVANFGSLTTQQMLSASVYTRKLGIDLKALTGIVSAFDDFETAANNAAKLSQAFGMNIDAMKMMKEQDPTKRLSMLQQAFKQTGKSVEKMNNSELKLLASQAGMDEETAKLAFSQRGLSMSYDQVQKASEKSKKKQLSQVEVMKKLADSIERVFGNPMQTQFTSFFDAFSKGFNSGIMKSREFKQLMRAINASLRLVFYAGRQVGKMFMSLFPGIKTISMGLTLMFSPKRYGDMTKKLKEIFKDFFTDLTSDPKAGAEKFIKRLKDLFEGFFKSDGIAGSLVLEGGKTMLKALGGIFSALLPMVLKGLVSVIKYITEFIKSPPGVPGAVTQFFKDLGSAMIDLISTLWVTLAPALGEMFMTLFEKVKPWLLMIGKGFLALVVGKMILSAFTGGLSGGIIATVIQKITDFFSSIFGGASGGGGAIASITKGFGSAIGGAIKGVAQGLKEGIKELADITFMEILSAAATVAALATIFMPAVTSFAAGLSVLASTMSVGEVFVVILIIGALAAAAYTIGLLAEALNKISLGTLISAAELMSIAVIFVKGGLYALSEAVDTLQSDFVGVDWIEVGKSMLALGAFAGALVLVTKAANELDVAKIMKGVKGLGASFGFLLALQQFTKYAIPLLKTVRNLDFTGALTQLKNIALVVGAIALIAFAASTFTIFATLGLAGLAIAAPFVKKLGEFIDKLAVDLFPKLVVMQVWSDILDFKKIAISMLALMGIFTAVTVIAGLTAIAGGAAYLAIRGIAPIAAFISELSSDKLGLLIALPKFESLIDRVKDIKKLIMSMGLLTGMIVAIGVIAGIVALAGIPAFAAMFALSTVTEFITELTKEKTGGSAGLLTTIMDLSRRIDQMPDPERVIKGTEAIINIVKVIGTMTALIPNLIQYAALDNATGIAFPLINKIVKSITDHIVPAVVNISRSIVGDPDEVEKKVLAVSEVIKSLTGIASISSSIQQLDTEEIRSSNAPSGLNAISTFIGSVFESTKGLVEKLTTFTLSPAQSESLKSVSTVLEAIGGLVKNLSLSPKTLDALKEKRWGGLVQSAPKPETIAAVGNYMRTVLGAVMSTMPSMLTNITRMADSIGDPAKHSEKVKALGDSFKIISDISQVVADIVEMTGGNENLKRVGTGGVVTSITQILGGLLNAFFTPANGQLLRFAFNGIKSLTDSIPEDVAVFTAKIKAVADAFGVLAKFAEVIQEISEIKIGGNPITNFIKDFVPTGDEGPLDALVSGVTTITTLMKDKMKAAFDGILEMTASIKDPAELNTKINVVGTAFNVIKTFANILKDVTAIAPAGSNADIVKVTLTKLVQALFGENVNGNLISSTLAGIAAAVATPAFDSLSSGAGLKKIKALEVIFKVLAQFMKAVGEMKTAGGGEAVLSTVTGIGKVFSTNDKKGNTAIGVQIANIVRGVSGLSAQLSEKGGTITGKHAANIRAFTHNLNASVSALNNVTGEKEGIITKVKQIGESFLKLEADMQKFGKDEDLKTIVKIGNTLKGNSKLTVKHEAVQINLNVQVNMSAEQIGKGVLKWSDGKVPSGPGERRFVTTQRAENTYGEGLNKSP